MVNSPSQDKNALMMKLEQKISSRQSHIDNTLKAIYNDGMNIQDYAVSSRKLSFVENDRKLNVNFGNGRFDNFIVNPHALTQLAAKYDINSTYAQKLTAIDVKKPSYEDSLWRLNLLVHTMNEFAKNNDNRFLMRTVQGELRGAMSDSFKRYSSVEVYKSFFQAAGQIDSNLIISDLHYDGLSGYIEMLKMIPYAVNIEGKTTYFCFGAQMRNSDFGAAALDVKSFMMQLICLNGMTRTSVLREIHRGARLGTTDIQLSSETLIAEGRAKALFVRDVLGSVLRPQHIEKQIAIIEGAARIEVDMKKEFEKLPKLGVHKGEVEELETIILNNREEDGLMGAPTLHKLAQGLSAVGRNRGGERERFLMDVTGKIYDKVKV